MTCLPTLQGYFPDDTPVGDLGYVVSRGLVTQCSVSGLLFVVGTLEFVSYESYPVFPEENLDNWNHRNQDRYRFTTEVRRTHWLEGYTRLGDETCSDTSPRFYPFLFIRDQRF